MKIELPIIEILSSGTFQDSMYFLPDIRLERKEYLKCNEILETIGLKWSKGKKAHVGEGEDTEKTFRAILESGELETLKEYRDRFQFFPTPAKLADRLVELAELSHGQYVLEPSAGDGAILDAIYRKIDTDFQAFKLMLYALELDPKKADSLISRFPDVFSTCKDFLKLKTTGYDRIIMNPPFSNSQDVKHILYAYSCLKPNGRIVAIASSSVKTRQGKIYDELRSLEPEIIDLEKDAFKESGTNVNAVILIIRK